MPELFRNEDELRDLWSRPDTRTQLLEGWRRRGYGAEQLAEMPRMIDAEKSDLFDVLAYIAFALAPLPRGAGATHAAQRHLRAATPTKQQAFLDFVLEQYVREGVARTRRGASCRTC